MATFVADVPVNVKWRGLEIANITTLGRDSETETVLMAGRRVTPIEPGDPIDIPDHLADAFAAEFGPQRGNANVSPGAAEAGRIPGLRRVD